MFKEDSFSEILFPLMLILGLGILLSVDAGVGAEATAVGRPSEVEVKWIFSYLVTGAEIAAGAIVTGAVARGIWDYIRYVFSRRKPQFDGIEVIRLKLGRGLTLGLEFTVASDILQTAVAPTRRDIVNLGAIVMLRTLLNYFLEREVRHGEKKRASSSSAHSSTPDLS